MAYEKTRMGARFLYKRGLLRVGGAEPPCWRFIPVSNETINNIIIRPGTHEKDHLLCRFGRPQKFIAVRGQGRAIKVVTGG